MFLGVAPDDCATGTPRYRIIPFGLEKTVSFGGGTAEGPAAILAASQEVELFDLEYEAEIYASYGVETLPIAPIPEDHAAAIDALDRRIEESLSEARVPIVLGGEHSITNGSARAFLKRHPDLVIVQFDAHLDLRKAYEGDPLSHASVMRECLENSTAELISIGIRNVSAEEFAYLKGNDRVTMITAVDASAADLPARLAKRVAGRPVFVSFDVDGLDPSIMPSTGTPEPGGLYWRQTLVMLRAVLGAGRLVGADVVELAPISGLHAPDFIAAKLIYKMMSYAACPAVSPGAE